VFTDEVQSYVLEENSWRKAKLSKIKRATIHVHPGGRLGNQLYFAAAAEDLRQELICRGIKVNLIWHSNTDYFKDIQTITSFKIDKLKRHKLIGRLIMEKPLLSQRNFIVRMIYSVWIRSERFRKYEIKDISMTELSKTESKNAYFIWAYHQVSEIALSAVAKWEREIELKRLKLIWGVEIPKNAIALSMRFGDFLDPENAHEQGNLKASYFQEALKRVNEDPSQNSEVWLFTDDPKSGLEELQKLNIKKIVDVRTLGLTTAQELILLSSFQKLILCNSTFSGWGGYLASKESEIVAPFPLTKNLQSERARASFWQEVPVIY